MDHDQGEATAEVLGLALRGLREQAGLSLRELGRRALYDYTRLSRAERGEILIPGPQVQVLDDVLHAGGLLVALRRGIPAAPAAVTARHDSVTGSEPVIVEIRLPGGGSITMTLSRRQFTQFLASGALSAAFIAGGSPDDAARAARALDEPARVDAEVLGYFRRSLAEFYRADKMLGPRPLIGPVLAQIDVLDGLRRSARPAHADPLLQILAQYGEMAGWLLQDSGDLAAAASWSRRAAEWAQCAGDANMTAYMLVRQANIAVLGGDHTAVVQLAAAARRTPGPIDPKLTALALQQQARGHARLGDQRDCLALLDQATDTLTRHPHVTTPGAPDYLQAYDLRTLTEQSAACHQLTGHPGTAVTILETAIAQTSPALTRDRGHLTAKLAVAITRTRHPDPPQPPASASRPSPSPATPAPPASPANCTPSTSSSPAAGPVTQPAAASTRHLSPNAPSLWRHKYVGQHSKVPIDDCRYLPANLWHDLEEQTAACHALDGGRA